MEHIQHGGNLLKVIEEFGGTQEDWLDLSTGVSPFTIDLPTFHKDVWRRLPDPLHVERLEGQAQEFYQTKYNCLAVPGSQFAIQHLSKILDGEVGIVEPTYGEYANSFLRNHRAYKSLSDIKIIDDVSSVILANPNNPDGRLYTSQELQELAVQLSKRNGYLVVDEAFMEFDDHNSLLNVQGRADNIIILRSVGKFFGLAGIRLGFVFSSFDVRIKFATYLGPWAVTGPALAIAEHIFTYPDIVNELNQKTLIRHKQMGEILKQSKLTIIGENKLFFLIEHSNAKALDVHLKEQKILTRIFNYNSSWMRIGLTPDQGEDIRLLNALNGFQV
ncbi:threonine-phosphate decarboxylase [Lentilitoribacter sp. Alg239-R112]|uniref:threonine-phosphate decarboxylase n=1 Tax=Lentilitoribacter sp. Alg239-R112 TaxID=2305987 RepID=UPI0013A697EE|nr:threonine-phosphate decarboxylase [Lentilitoribacter sp. Alg239-R112]